MKADSAPGAPALLAGVLVALLTGLAWPGDLPAQGPAPGGDPHDIREERGFVMLGTQRIAVGPLNEAFRDAGLPGFSNTALTIGAGGMRSLGPILLGGEAHGLLGSDETSADGALETRVRGGYGWISAGRDFFPRRAHSLYPLVGFGAGTLTVRIDARGVPDFDELLRDPRRGVEVHRTSALVMAGLGGDYLLEFPTLGPERRGVALGARVGWVRSLGEWGWRTERGGVEGGPSLHPSGPFVRIQLGVGVRP